MDSFGTLNLFLFCLSDITDFCIDDDSCILVTEGQNEFVV